MSLLLSGRVRTMDRARPVARNLLIRDGRVAALDTDEPADEVLELPDGAVALPGFVDPHIHLLATAALRWSTDVSGAGSVGDLLALLRRATGAWIRAVGFDDALVAERRWPTVAELDTVGRPVVLHHSSGHAALRNALAGGEAPDHEVDLDSLGRDLSAAGITAVVDATVTNSAAEVSLLSRLPQRVVVMPGADRLDGLSFGAGVGHAKVYASDGQLEALVAGARAAGFPVAVHVLDIDELEKALGVVRRGDRLEHVALCLPEQVERIAASGADVVTQPSFVRYRAERYRREVSAVEREWLYRARSLIDAGVRVAASSDSPIAPARPLQIVRAAMDRDIAPGERVPVETALAMVTRSAAEIARLDGGVLRAGAPADVVVLGADPVHVPTDEIDSIPVLRTLMGSRSAP